MIKSLTIAAFTFAVLGLYYDRAEPEVTMAEQVGSLAADPVQAARSAALNGISIAKQGLMDTWQSGLFAGRYGGAKYNALVTVRGQRARIESIGRAIGAGGSSRSYRLSVDVYRTARAGTPDDDVPDYSYRIRPASSD